MTQSAGSSGLLLGFMLSFLLVSAAQDVQDVSARPGQNVTLRCQDPRHGAVSLLAWTRTDLRQDDYVLFYRDRRVYGQYQHQSFRGRVRLRDASSVKDGDFSVLLQNVSTRDAGTYECRAVMRPPGGGDGAPSEFKRLISLNVSGEEEPEEGGEKVGMVILGQEGVAVLVVSLLVLFVLLVGLAAVLMRRRIKRRCPPAACLRCFHPPPPAEPPAVKASLTLL